MSNIILIKGVKGRVRESARFSEISETAVMPVRSMLNRAVISTPPTLSEYTSNEAISFLYENNIENDLQNPIIDEPVEICRLFTNLYVETNKLMEFKLGKADCFESIAKKNWFFANRDGSLSIAHNSIFNISYIKKLKFKQMCLEILKNNGWSTWKTRSMKLGFRVWDFKYFCGSSGMVIKFINDNELYPNKGWRDMGVHHNHMNADKISVFFGKPRKVLFCDEFTK